MKHRHETKKARMLDRLTLLVGLVDRQVAGAGAVRETPAAATVATASAPGSPPAPCAHPDAEHTESRRMVIAANAFQLLAQAAQGRPVAPDDVLRLAVRLEQFVATGAYPAPIVGPQDGADGSATSQAADDYLRGGSAPDHDPGEAPGVG